MERKGKRLSILKPKKPRSPFADVLDLTEVEPTVEMDPKQNRLSRKVRFSSNFVKEFRTEDNQTIWNTTYEERIDRSEDSHSVNKTASSTISDTKEITSLASPAAKQCELTKKSSEFNATDVFENATNVIGNNSMLDFGNISCNEAESDFNKTALAGLIGEEDLDNTVLGTIDDTGGMQVDKSQHIDDNQIDGDLKNIMLYQGDELEITESVPLKGNHNRKDTGDFDVGGDNKFKVFEDDMSFSKNKSMVFEDDIEITQQGPSKTMHFNTSCVNGDMEITQQIPMDIKDKTNNGKNMLFKDNGLNMDLTQGLSNFVDMEQTQRIGLEGARVNNTIYFDADCDDGMELTKFLPTGIMENEIATSNRTMGFEDVIKEVNQTLPQHQRTIHFGIDCEDGDMELTRHVQDENMYAGGNQKDLFEDSIQQISSKKGNSRKTIHFSADGEEGDMEFTKPIPTNIFEAQQLASKNRKTIHFNTETDDGDMELTKPAPTKILKDIVVGGNRPALSEDSVQQISSTNGNSRKTIHFSVDGEDDDMEFTKPIPTNIIEVHKIASKTRKTIHFNVDREDGDMELTKHAPTKILEDIVAGGNRSALFENSIQQISSKNGNSRKTIHFSADGEDDDMEFTKPIPTNIVEAPQVDPKNRKTIHFNAKSGDDDMELTKHAPTKSLEDIISGGNKQALVEDSIQQISSKKGSSRKTIHFSADGEDGDMEFTKPIPTSIFEAQQIASKNRKTIHFNAGSEDGDMELTKHAPTKILEDTIAGVNIPASFEDSIQQNSSNKGNSRKTIHFSAEDEDGDMAFTKPIPTSIFEAQQIASKNRKTIHFNAESEDGDMELAKPAPTKILKDIVVGGNRPALSEDSVQISSMNGNSRKTIHFKADGEDDDMEFTKPIPTSIFEAQQIASKNRKTIHFNAGSEDGDMELTKHAPTKILEDTIAGVNVPASFEDSIQQISSNKGNSRKTIHFSAEDEDGDMEFTKPIPTSIFEAQQIASKNRKTIHFNAGSEDGDMELTKHVPTKIIEDIVAGGNRPPLFEDSIQQISSNKENSMKTIHFRANGEGDDMEFTKPISTKSTSIFEAQQIASKNRKTIHFNAGSEDGDMELTKHASTKILEGTIAGGNIPASFEDSIQQISSNKGNSRKTIHFRADGEDDDMEFTKPISTSIFEEQQIASKNRKTIHFNVGSEDGDMELTKHAPTKILENIVADGNRPGLFEDSMQQISLKRGNTRKTIHFSVDGEDGDMEFTKPISTNIVEAHQIASKNRRTIHFNPGSEDGDMELTKHAPTKIIEDIVTGGNRPALFEECIQQISSKSNSRKTILFSANGEEGDLEFTKPIPTSIFEAQQIASKNRKTIQINTGSEDGDMELTKHAPMNILEDTFAEGNRPALFEDSIQQISSKGNSRKIIHFSADGEEGDMEFTKPIPINMVEAHQIASRNRQTIHFNAQNEEGDMELTKQPTTNILEDIVAGSNRPALFEDSIQQVSSKKVNSRKTIHFSADGHEGDMEFTKPIPTNIIEVHQTVPKTKTTMLFNAKSEDGDMELTNHAPTKNLEDIIAGGNKKNNLFEDQRMEVTEEVALSSRKAIHSTEHVNMETMKQLPTELNETTTLNEEPNPSEKSNFFKDYVNFTFHEKLAAHRRYSTLFNYNGTSDTRMFDTLDISADDTPDISVFNENAVCSQNYLQPNSIIQGSSDEISIRKSMDKTDELPPKSRYNLANNALDDEKDVGASCKIDHSDENRTEEIENLDPNTNIIQKNDVETSIDYSKFRTKFPLFASDKSFKRKESLLRNRETILFKSIRNEDEKMGTDNNLPPHRRQTDGDVAAQKRQTEIVVQNSEVGHTAPVYLERHEMNTRSSGAIAKVVEESPSSKPRLQSKRMRMRDTPLKDRKNISLLGSNVSPQFPNTVQSSNAINHSIITTNVDLTTPIPKNIEPSTPIPINTGLPTPIPINTGLPTPIPINTGLPTPIPINTEISTPIVTTTNNVEESDDVSKSKVNHRETIYRKLCETSRTTVENFSSRFELQNQGEEFYALKYKNYGNGNFLHTIERPANVSVENIGKVTTPNVSYYSSDETQHLLNYYNSNSDMSKIIAEEYDEEFPIHQDFPINQKLPLGASTNSFNIFNDFGETSYEKTKLSKNYEKLDEVSFVRPSTFDIYVENDSTRDRSGCELAKRDIAEQAENKPVSIQYKTNEERSREDSIGAKTNDESAVSKLVHEVEAMDISMDDVDALEIVEAPNSLETFKSIPQNSNKKITILENVLLEDLKNRCMDSRVEIHPNRDAQRSIFKTLDDINVDSIKTVGAVDISRITPTNITATLLKDSYISNSSYHSIGGVSGITPLNNEETALMKSYISSTSVQTVGEMEIGDVNPENNKFSSVSNLSVQNVVGGGVTTRISAKNIDLKESKICGATTQYVDPTTIARAIVHQEASKIEKPFKSKTLQKTDKPIDARSPTLIEDVAMDISFEESNDVGCEQLETKISIQESARNIETIGEDIDTGPITIVDNSFHTNLMAHNEALKNIDSISRSTHPTIIVTGNSFDAFEKSAQCNQNDNSTSRLTISGIPKIEIDKSNLTNDAIDISVDSENNSFKKFVNISRKSQLIKNDFPESEDTSNSSGMIDNISGHDVLITSTLESTSAFTEIVIPDLKKMSINSLLEFGRNHLNMDYLPVNLESCEVKPSAEDMLELDLAKHRSSARQLAILIKERADKEAVESRRDETVEIVEIVERKTVYEKIKEKARDFQDSYVILVKGKQNYTIKTLFKSIHVRVAVDDDGFVTDILVKSMITAESPAFSLFLNKLFMDKMSNEKLRSAIGCKYNIFTLLDYIHINHQALNKMDDEFDNLLFDKSITMDYKYKVQYPFFDEKLMTSLRIYVDLSDMNNLNENVVSVETQLGRVREKDIKALVSNVKGFEFLTSFISNVDWYFEEERLKLERRAT